MPMADRWLPRIPYAPFPQARFRSPVRPANCALACARNIEHKDVFARLKEKGDLWADFWKKRQRLEQAIELAQRSSARREPREAP